MDFQSSIVTQNDENEINTKTEIKEEPLWLGSAHTEIKYEFEETPNSDIHLQNEGISSEFASESNNSTCRSFDLLEVKEEPWWDETMPAEVKAESKQLIDPAVSLHSELKSGLRRILSNTDVTLPEILKVCRGLSQFLPSGVKNNEEERAHLESITSSSKGNVQSILQLLQMSSMSHSNLKGMSKQIDSGRMNHDCDCKQWCFDRIHHIERKQILEQFWKLGNFNTQKTYLLNCLKLDKCDSSLLYFIPTAKGEKVQVCKAAFLSIHGLQNHATNVKSIAAGLKKSSFKAPSVSFTNLSEKSLTQGPGRQNAMCVRNSMLRFKARERLQRPLTWRKKRALALLLLYKMQLQLMHHRLQE